MPGSEWQRFRYMLSGIGRDFGWAARQVWRSPGISALITFYQGIEHESFAGSNRHCLATSIALASVLGMVDLANSALVRTCTFVCPTPNSRCG